MSIHSRIGDGTYQTPEKIVERLYSQFMEAAEADGDVKRIREVLYDAFDAETSVRVADPQHPRGWTYAMIPDHPSRLLSARLLSQLNGLLKDSGAKVTINNATNVQVSVKDQVADAIRIGALTEEELLRDVQMIVKAAGEALAATSAKGGLPSPKEQVPIEVSART